MVTIRSSSEEVTVKDPETEAERTEYASRADCDVWLRFRCSACGHETGWRQVAAYPVVYSRHRYPNHARDRLTKSIERYASTPDDDHVRFDRMNEEDSKCPACGYWQDWFATATYMRCGGIRLYTSTGICLAVLGLLVELVRLIDGGFPMSRFDMAFSAACLVACVVFGLQMFVYFRRLKRTEVRVARMLRRGMAECSFTDERPEA